MRIARLAFLLLAGCTAGTAPPSAPPGAGASAAPAPLAGTRWRLVQFQSPEDAIGLKKPYDPNAYILELLPDGRLALQLECNRAVGHWEAHATGPDQGSISLNAPAATSAACLHESWESRLARDLAFVRSYTRVGDTLNLALKLDSGIYTLRRISP
jgi:hypothetical protein